MKAKERHEERINTNDLVFAGTATVTKEADVEEVVKTLNNITAFRGR